MRDMNAEGMDKFIAIRGIDSPEDRLALSIFLVEASPAEYMSLWVNHSHESWERPKGRTVLKWESLSDGRCVQVGSIDKRPINVSLRWAWLDGQLVSFWYGSSPLVDYNMIEEWLGKHFTRRYDRNTRRAVCDASNFHHCLGALQEHNEAEVIEEYPTGFTADKYRLDLGPIQTPEYTNVKARRSLLSRVFGGFRG